MKREVVDSSEVKVGKHKVVAIGPKVPSTGRLIVPIHLKTAKQNIAIIAAGDFHVGADSFNEKAFSRFIQRLKTEAKKQPTYVILMGDLFDSIHFRDKRFSTDSVKKTMDESMDMLADTFKELAKIKDLHFVGAITGNHEAKYCGGDVNLIYNLYKRVDHKIQPLGFRCYIYFDLIYKGVTIQTLRTVAFHGAGNAGTSMGRSKVVKKFLDENGETYDVFFRKNNIIFYGHTHEVKVDSVSRIQPEVRTGAWKQYTQYNCLTGSFMDIANFDRNSYAAEKAYSPMPVGFIKVTVSIATLHVEAVTNDGINPTVDPIGWGQI